MVQPDVGPPAKYKENSVDDPLRHNSGRLGSQQTQTLQPLSNTAQPQKQGPASPVQPSLSLPPTTYPPPPHQLGNGVLHHHNPYGPPPQESSYYTTHSPYTSNPVSAHYPSSGPPDLMASTAQMQRPYPSIYHTPQSSSPASVASQPHEQHGRNMYSQSPQMPPQMFGYPPYSPMNPVQPSPYGTHQSPQQHPLTTQPLMMPPQKAPSQAPPHQSPHLPTSGMSSSPIMKLDSSQNPTTSQQTMLNPPLTATNSHSMSASNPHASPPLGGTTSSAAPGPIPATTPLVVRQDSNGVQWIAFEYSRDRVKMEYTIRCDVESVIVDTLTQEFKTENCVYPRACCSKDQYRGNRLVYETECNAVGWALAELNPALRGKRGLIQRAVDSWRNSNQDPRLRSRRVRRMAKINRRQSVPAQSAHMAQQSPVGPPAPPGPPGPVMSAMPAPVPRPNLGPMSMGPPQMHHHHQPDGSPNEEVSGTDYPGHRSMDTRLPQPSIPDLRPAHIFHDAPTTLNPGGSASGPSMPPLLRGNSLTSLNRHTIATSAHMDSTDHDIDEKGPTNDDLFSHLPDGKRRKFILVDDPQRGCRVRVKVVLDKVNMDEIPDSYRESNAVYPRTYFPIQMRDENRVVPAKRFFRDDAEQADDPEASTIGRTTVPAPSLDGETEIAVPKISRRKHRKELMLNDLGYRMSWSQSRVFAGRMLFLQRSLDAYRDKMRSSMLAAGQETGDIPDHFDTRRGKRRFLERGRRLESGESAAQRSAEEVEG
ncbi:Pc21g00790 [Penicillium rubens Wisconsin 54-1255]|uniref:Pc21g00790 protein n=1 Tax=Penicillium rubens (strain ATCC 28089 / DSM 1075 / NRRL 1951 / Wisconsin 54-1255) TaxID=500485 RepID=B6HHG2_PENRW|nr:Pc21g00790 [Penicillium rubens Wisconsin 54-1255]